MLCCDNGKTKGQLEAQSTAILIKVTTLFTALKIPKAHSYTATHCFVSLWYTVIPTIHINYLPKFFTSIWTYSLYRGRDRERVRKRGRDGGRE